MRVKVLHIDAFKKLLLQAAAAETYPRESFGYLLGQAAYDYASVHAVYPCQQIAKDTQTVVVDDQSVYQALDMFGDRVIGDFHSHPNEPARLSRMSDFEDPKEQRMSDEWNMLHDKDSFDGMISLIVSIHLGTKKPWLFSWKAFTVYRSRIYKVNIEFN